MSIIDTLTSIFSTGPDPVPRYIWEPIARQESGLVPTKWNQNGEDSRGLFQINVAAHPEYAGVNLFDPSVNAQIARDDFIRPAWEQAKRLFSDPGEQAAYVWRYGIRPDWAGVQARGADKELMAQARTLATGGTDGIQSGVDKGGKVLGDGGPLTKDFWVGAGLNVGYFAALVLLALFGAWAFMKAFGLDTPVKEAVKTGVKVATTAASGGVV